MAEVNPHVSHTSATDNREPAKAARSRTYGILIVDDEPSVRDVLKLAMSERGFSVWAASSGHEALDLYRRHGEAVDVVLMDVRMPGLDGPETLAALQNLNPQVCCCFMSGAMGKYTEERLLDIGAVAIIPKPFRLEEVSRVLQDKAFHHRQAIRK